MQLKLTLVFAIVLAAACTRTETVPTSTTGVAPSPDTTTTTVIADLVVVPDVVGFVLRGAVIAANRVGLEIVVNDGDSAADNSLVVAQEPPGGTELQSGGVVGVRTEARVKGRPEPVGAMADLLRGLEELDYSLIRDFQSNFWFTGNNSAYAVIGEPGLLNIWVFRDRADRNGDWRIFKEGGFPIPSEGPGDFVEGEMQYWGTEEIIVAYFLPNQDDSEFYEALTSVLGPSTVAQLSRSPHFEPVPGRPWFGPDGEPVDVLSAYQGLDHCDWMNAVFLNIGWPVGTKAETADDSRQYVRRGPMVLGSERFVSPYIGDTELPDDAKFTGYTDDTGMELWLAPSDQDNAAYLVYRTHIELWPRAEPGFACR